MKALLLASLVALAGCSTFDRPNSYRSLEEMGVPGDLAQAVRSLNTPAMDKTLEARK